MRTGLRLGPLSTPSSLPSLLPRSGRVPCVGPFFSCFFFVVHFLPPSFLPFISSSPRLLHQSPPCVPAEDHTGSRIPAQLMTNLNMEPLNLPLPPPQSPPTPATTSTTPASPTPTPTHTFQLFLPPLKTSQRFFLLFFYFFLIPLQSPSTSPPPGGRISPGSSHVLLSSAARLLL